jgi:hypothetical protein
LGSYQLIIKSLQGYVALCRVSPAVGNAILDTHQEMIYGKIAQLEWIASGQHYYSVAVSLASLHV